MAAMFIKKTLSSIIFKVDLGVNLPKIEDLEHSKKELHTILMKQRDDWLKPASAREYYVNIRNGQGRTPLVNFVLSRFLLCNTFKEHRLMEKEKIIFAAFKKLGAVPDSQNGRDIDDTNWICEQITDPKCCELLGIK